MGIDPDQLRQYVIRPALTLLGMESTSAENLMLGTAAQESHCGHYLHQLDKGPALGIFQMEPATYRDIWVNYISYRSGIKSAILSVWEYKPEPEEMTTNLLYAAVMCRIHYRRVSAPLPDSNVQDLAKYWKNYYNTNLGSGTVEEFEENYKKFIG